MKQYLMFKKKIFMALAQITQKIDHPRTDQRIWLNQNLTIWFNQIRWLFLGLAMFGQIFKWKFPLTKI